MMKHNLTYLAAITLLAASCTSDDIGIGNILSGDGNKTPIAIQTSISTDNIASRAADKKFEVDDVLLAYIEAGVTTDGIFSSADNPYKGLKTFTLTANADNTDGDNHADLYGYVISADGPHITETEDEGLQLLYWDDYSDTEHDLRTTGAGIRLKYGYCYNGGNANATNNTSDDAKANGTLTWTINNQATADDVKHSDLLFAKTQTPVSYLHGDAETSNHGVLVLPYSHAMSKITVNVTADKGFNAAADNFASSALTLQHINTICNVTAPTGSVTSSTPTTIGAFKSATTNTSATFQAIIAPGTNLSVGNILATISNVDGNKYDIPITADLLTPWASKLTPGVKVSYGDIAQAKVSRASSIDEAKGYLTQSGVHYILNVVLDKQTITIRATLADWDAVSADGKSQIIFENDVTGKDVITAQELKAGGIDFYKSNTNSAFSAENMGTMVYNDVTNKWEYTKLLYWQGQSDNSYFRAISPAGASTSELTQGINLLWGTSAAEGKSGTAEETAITPRTGDVALNFDHLMSRLSVKLETSSDAAAVTLTGATIKITNLATSGTYNIVNATVSAGSPAAIMLEGKPSDFTEYVVPQTIGNDARLIITLADGTTYSLQLNKCVLTGTETVVNKWTKGKSYTYTIHLEKETATFRALVKEWDEATGSGNANLEWD